MSRFALVRIDNSKFSETYSDPILRAESLEELEIKLSQKTATTVGVKDEPLENFEFDEFGGFW